MRARINPFSWMRHRRRRVGRVLMPVLIAGWLGAAGPCAAMSMTADAAPADAAPAGHEHAAHAAAGAGHTEPAAGERNAGHDGCPHCPGAADGAPEAEHRLCTAIDDVSDSKRSAKPAAPDLKTPLPAAAVSAAAVPAGLVAPRRPLLYYRVFPPSRPLNLQHCVFIV